MKSKKVFEARLNYLGICDSYQLSQENKMFLELRYYKLPFSQLYLFFLLLKDPNSKSLYLGMSSNRYEQP